MEKPLRILHLEDERDFVSLVSSMLASEGLAVDVVPVGNYNEFVAALERETFDLILADYLVPGCNGIQALQWARKTHPDIPFLLISGTIGEDAAIESLRCGATDYVLKNKLERLAPTVRRALQESLERAHSREAAEALKKSEASLAAAQRIAHLGSWELELTDSASFAGDRLR